MSSPDVVSYGQRLHDVAALRPDDVDLVMVAKDGSERPVPWRELESRANQIGRLLEEHGVSASSFVALALPNCLDHILVTLAIWKLGATLLPLRHDMPQWEMDRLLALAKSDGPGERRHRQAAAPTLTRRDIDASRGQIRRCPARPDPRVRVPPGVVGLHRAPKLIVTPVRGVVADNPQRPYSPISPPRSLSPPRSITSTASTSPRRRCWKAPTR